MNGITRMFADSVFSKPDHAGYLVVIRNGSGQTKEFGPYSVEIARECASEFADKYTVDIIDAETGEIVL